MYEPALTGFFTAFFTAGAFFFLAAVLVVPDFLVGAAFFVEVEVEAAAFFGLEGAAAFFFVRTRVVFTWPALSASTRTAS